MASDPVSKTTGREIRLGDITDLLEQGAPAHRVILGWMALSRLRRIARMSDKSETTALYYWQKEHQGTHVCYLDDKEVAAVQGSGLAGWRYRIGLGEWSRYFGTVVAAKREAESNVR